MILLEQWMEGTFTPNFPFFPPLPLTDLLPYHSPPPRKKICLMGQSKFITEPFWKPHEVYPLPPRPICHPGVSPFSSPSQWSSWFITILVQGLISVHKTLSSLDEPCWWRAKTIMKHWPDSSQQWELGNNSRSCFPQWTKTFRTPSITRPSCGSRLPPFIRGASISKPGSLYVY